LGNLFTLLIGTPISDNSRRQTFEGQMLFF